jgi:uncharacterized protein (DUF305 family)
MDDDWRLRVTLENDSQARQLADHLANFDREHGLKTSFVDRVVVSRDDAEIFGYTATREQADATQQAVRQLADEHQLSVSFELKHWHPTAEEWEDPDKPLPDTDADRAAERAELMGEEREESQAQGFAEFEVRVKCPHHRDARALAKRLTDEGIPNVHRWQFVVVGATDEDSANALAERIRREAPEGSEVTAEGGVSEIVSESPYATPFTPFAVFGGLEG